MNDPSSDSEGTWVPAEDDDTDKIVQARRNGVPEVYANSLSVIVSLTDILVVLDRNGSTVSLLNMSYSMAKTLSVQLGLAIAQIEQRSTKTIMTAKDIEHLFETRRTDTNALDEGTKPTE